MQLGLQSEMFLYSVDMGKILLMEHLGVGPVQDLNSSVGIQIKLSGCFTNIIKTRSKSLGFTSNDSMKGQLKLWLIG